MRNRSVRLSLFAFYVGLTLAVLMLPGMNSGAHAQTIEIGPGGVRINPDRDFRRGPRWRISEREAVRIARRTGLVEVTRVVYSGREWRVSGISRRGDFMRVVIDARSGNVVRIVRRR